MAVLAHVDESTARATAGSIKSHAVATASLARDAAAHFAACQPAAGAVFEITQVFAPSAPPSSSLMQVTLR